MTRRIALDARKLEDFGIGTTIRGILEGLASIEPDHLEVVVLGPARIHHRVPQSPIFRMVDLDTPHYSLREIFRVGQAAERAGASLLHVPHYVAPMTSLPLVTTIHDLIHLRIPRRDLPLGGRLYARWMLRRATGRSRRIVTVSQAVREEITARYPHARDKLVVIPNGVSQPALPIVPPAEREPFLLFVGNDKPHKNVDRLVQGFEQIRGEHSGVRLVLVGAPFARFSGRPGVDARGFVDEDTLGDLYRRTTALVQPSLFEGFGLPVAEAMSHGAPVIVSAIAPLLEVAGDAAIAIDDPTDVSSITRAIETVLRDDEVRVRSARVGPAIASRFRWSSAARSLIDLWTELL